MLRLLTLLTLVAFSIKAFSAAPATAAPALPNIEFKNLPGASLNEHKLQFSDLTGKIVVVDFWASWCEPCKEALPHYNQLAAKYKNQVVFIGINEDDRIQDRDSFLKSNPVKFAIFADEKKKFADNFKVLALPTLYVFDKNLKPVAMHRGFNGKNTQDLEKILQEQLQSK